MKRHGHPLNDNTKTLWETICSMDNLRLAHKNASHKKGFYQEVQIVNQDPDRYLTELQSMLIHHTYKTSPYTVFKKFDGRKVRDIYQLPYFPDRICQWAVLQVIEPILIKHFIPNTYSAIPDRGIHRCLSDVRKAIDKDPEGCQYCYKFDARKYYQSINHSILKAKFRKRFKDPNLLWWLDEVIDSVSTVDVEAFFEEFPGEDLDPETGLPIGNYMSQYCGNFYLSEFDHWIKEEKKVKHYFRYMDDIVVFASSKERLHELRLEIEQYFDQNLKLKIKHNWQIFPSYVRGVDFVGYRSFKDFTLLRKTTCKELKSKMLSIKKLQEENKPLTYSKWCAINSYQGWLKHCNSCRLSAKYIGPIKDFATKFYIENIKGKGKQNGYYRTCKKHSQAS